MTRYKLDVYKRQAHSSVGGSMAVSTDDGHSRLGQTCFGTHHMDNSVFGGTDFENRDTVFGTVIFEHRQLPGGLQILYRQMLILCGYIVIGAGCDPVSYTRLDVYKRQI